MKGAVILSLALAVGTSLWTWWPRQAVSVGPVDKKDQLLTANGAKISPEDVALLRVVTWNEEEKSPKVFEVAEQGGKWVIPSHFNYPADGGTRVGETAGSVLNVPRGPLVASDSKRHAEMDVLDPLAEGLSGDKGRGKRITLKDAGGEVLVDLIVGKEAGTDGVRYVREAKDDNVYTAKVDPDIRTAFKDWVKTDLLNISSSDLRELSILDYSVDEVKGIVKERSATAFEKPKDASEWSSPKTPKGKQVNQDVVGDIVSELTSLRLVGVRPYHAAWLQDRGFYIEPRSKALYGNEGQLVVGHKDGLRYHLFFGEIALGDEEDTEAKLKKKKEKSGSAGKGEKEDQDGKTENGHNRYMAIFVQYDPKLDENRKKEKAGEKKGKAGEGAEPKKEPGKKKSPEKKEPDGKQKALKAQQRFGRFFYVISDASFQKLRPPLKKLFQDKEIKKADLPGEKVPDDVSLEKKDKGLQYADIKKGDGTEAEAGDRVEVHYTGWLFEGKKKFDSSLDSKGKKPFSFTLGQGQVIKGWDEGVKGMKVGGKRKLVIPPALGYGDRGSPPKIPAKARLVFDVELLKVEKKAKKPGKAPSKKKAEPKFEH